MNELIDKVNELVDIGHSYDQILNWLTEVLLIDEDTAKDWLDTFVYNKE